MFSPRTRTAEQVRHLAIDLWLQPAQTTDGTMADYGCTKAVKPNSQSLQAFAQSGWPANEASAMNPEHSGLSPSARSILLVMKTQSNAIFPGTTSSLDDTTVLRNQFAWNGRFLWFLWEQTLRISGTGAMARMTLWQRLAGLEAIISVASAGERRSEVDNPGQL